MTCHVADGPAAFRALTDGVSHDTLINNNLVTPEDGTADALILGLGHSLCIGEGAAKCLPPNF